MIRRTLPATQAATYSIDLPNPKANGMPTPAGTGFFISPDGWFVTAAHVVATNGNPHPDLHNAWLMKENGPDGFTGGMCQFPKLEALIPEVDFALLKIDFEKNADKVHLKGRTGFPFITASSRTLDVGEPVYAFGYPLSEYALVVNSASVTAGHASHCPRTTSAIIAATMDKQGMVWTSSDPQVYVLDKALNYGNSGGPIIATDTGRVHALCSRFQPVAIPQPHIKDKSGNPMPVLIPSLYGVVSRLSNPAVLSCLDSHGISVAED